MKKIIVEAVLGLILSFFLQPVYGQTSFDVPGFVSLNLNTLVQNAGVADFVDNHKRNWAGPSVRVAWYPDDPSSPNRADKAWVGVEVAVPWDTSNGHPAGVFGWVGFRVDTIASKIMPTKLGYLTIPNIEFGPGYGYLYNEKQSVGFLGFVKHF